VVARQADVYGPYSSYERARPVAYYWQRMGYHTRIYYRNGYWWVKVWD
jgi:hypothetical protein